MRAHGVAAWWHKDQRHNQGVGVRTGVGSVRQPQRSQRSQPRLVARGAGGWPGGSRGLAGGKRRAPRSQRSHRAERRPSAAPCLGPALPPNRRAEPRQAAPTRGAPSRPAPGPLPARARASSRSRSRCAPAQPPLRSASGLRGPDVAGRGQAASRGCPGCPRGKLLQLPRLPRLPRAYGDWCHSWWLPTSFYFILRPCQSRPPSSSL